MAKPTYPETQLLDAWECPCCHASVDPACSPCRGCKIEWCTAHRVLLGEGDICAECERLGQRDLDLGKRVHWATNSTFVDFYTNRNGMAHTSWSNHKGHKLRDIAWDTWQLGKDQALLEAMIRGFSLCVAKPVIDEIHDRMDADYEEHCRLEALGCRDDIEDCGNHTFSDTF